MLQNNLWPCWETARLFPIYSRSVNGISRQRNHLGMARELSLSVSVKPRAARHAHGINFEGTNNAEQRNQNRRTVNPRPSRAIYPVVFW